MKSHASRSKEAGPASDDLVARAMDSVLQAERDAQTAVAECERAGGRTLEQARQQARSILERAQRRIVSLHARAAQRLELDAAKIAEAHRKPAVLAVGRLSDPVRRSAALDRLALSLTSIQEIRAGNDT
ncbi:MAG: hypothetical protein ABJC66_11130 [Gammaproteobacteria bacterium]